MSLYLQTSIQPKSQEGPLLSDQSTRVTEEIAKILDPIQKTIEGKELCIIGGSACAILDHIYMQSPLSFRDLDLAIVMGKCMDQEDVLQFAEAIKSQIPNVERLDCLEKRIRTPNALPLKEETPFCAGIGFFLHLNHEHLPILDISLFAHDQDLRELNGLLFQDGISIVLSEKRHFAQFLLEAKKKPFEKLVDEGWVKQPHGAYQNWSTNKLEIRCWEEISRRPRLSALRLVRTLAKKGILQSLITPNGNRNALQKQWKDLNQLITSNPFNHYGMQSRLFKRCLADRSSALELKALCQVGALDWLPWLRESIDWLSPEEIEQKLGDSPRDALETRLLTLTSDQTLEQQIHTLFFAFGGPELSHASMSSVWRRLEHEFNDLGRVNLVACDKLLKQRQEHTFGGLCSRVIASHSLTKEEKLSLLTKVLVSSCEELVDLFPNANPEMLKVWWARISLPRVGFFSGVFDPFTNTHLEIIAHAINEMFLDRVVVAPVYLAKELNRPALPWRARWLMVKEGLNPIPEAQPVDETFESILQTGIGDCLAQLRKTAAVFVHIAGADAFNRFKNLGKLDEYLKEQLRIFVIDRLGVGLSNIPSKYKDIITVFKPIIPVGVKATLSSRDIRKLVESGNDITNLVPNKVRDIIVHNQFYLPPPSLRMPWEIFASEEFFPLLEKHLPYAKLQSLSAALQSRDRPIAIFKVKRHASLATVALEYRQSAESKPILLENSCSDDKTLETADILLQELIHKLLGH